MSTTHAKTGPLMPTLSPSPRRRSATVLIVGSLVALFGLAAVVGGGKLLSTHSSKTDNDGFYTSGFNSLETPAPALVSERLEVGTDEGLDWLLRNGWLGSVRITATGTPSKPVFVGIARQRDVDRYLRDVQFDKIADLELDPFSVTTRRHPGTTTASEPAAQTFWAASARGSSRQTVEWQVRQGDWAVVVMNADGTPGVATSVSVGAKFPLLYWVAISLVLGGAALTVGGGLVIVVGAIRRGGPRS
jgi:hypothetical protein